MTATVQLRQGAAIALDACDDHNAVLLTLKGAVYGEMLNCALIPVDRIDAVIASLQLVRSQVKHHAVSLS